jgi:hypothetical protein
VGATRKQRLERSFQQSGRLARNWHLRNAWAHRIYSTFASSRRTLRGSKVNEYASFGEHLPSGGAVCANRGKGSIDVQDRQELSCSHQREACIGLNFPQGEVFSTSPSSTLFRAPSDGPLAPQNRVLPPYSKPRMGDTRGWLSPMPSRKYSAEGAETSKSIGRPKRIQNKRIGRILFRKPLDVKLGKLLYW